MTMRSAQQQLLEQKRASDGALGASTLSADEDRESARGASCSKYACVRVSHSLKKNKASSLLLATKNNPSRQN